MLRADGVGVTFGDRRVFADLDLAVPPGRRVGLLGENGVGKSTLLAVLAGELEPDTGRVERPVATALLRQEVRVDAGAPLSAILEAELGGLRRIERELEAAGAALADGDPEAADRYAALLEAADAAELWGLDARRDELLDGLGVGHLALDRPVGEVSGGQRSRVALAALLLARPDALLLDEPTNHLDDAAVAFLAERLRAWRGPVLFASHDRAFLDEVATDLVDIDPAASDGVTRYGGGYSDYLAAKAAERARWEARFAEEGREQTRLEHAVAVTARELAPGRARRDNEKMGYDYRADHHQQQVARRIRNAAVRLDGLRGARIAEPPPLLSFAGIPGGSHLLEGDVPLVTVEGARVDGRLALDGLELAPDARLLVTGPNGAGKSTLLSLLAGRLVPDAGRVARRKGLRVAVLDQDVRWERPERTPRELYERTVGERRAAEVPLAGLGLLAARDLDRPVGRLSIGQQRRTALALIVARPPHVFLLDEPTNHLSLSLATELEEALGGYPGAVVVASHDRWLRRRWRGAELALPA
ncbi:ABC-F family ATP-binding cassette domain-containing protein [Protaetiibacter intestinalis]|uniref:ABC-F family ATP-binding cassette domain-containing protein n=1 Tax=Protaetiibacter intestinalis TaxID=2419774 RepID=UPI001D057B35|nr:ABC-F family ATP-binding cassette domain-containing protein [Protaetiibacter intestinalis]